MSKARSIDANCTEQCDLPKYQKSDLTLGKLRNGAIVYFEGVGAYEVAFKIGASVYMKPAPSQKEE